MENPKIYVVYWHYYHNDPAMVSFYLEGFLNAVGGSSWLKTVDQYYQDDVFTKFAKVPITTKPGMLAGTWSDPPYAQTLPATWHPSDADVQQEVIRAVNHFGASNFLNPQPNAMIIVATPHNHNTPGFPATCSYHSSTLSGAFPYINLAYMPDAGYGSCGYDAVDSTYNWGPDDGVSVVAGHEIAETITDPYSPSGWNGSGGGKDEIGDICQWDPGYIEHTVPGQILGQYYLFPTQPLWSNRANSCWQLSAVPPP